MRRLISICVCLMFLGLPGTSGYAKKIGPQTAPDEETPVAGQKPEVAKVKELLKEGKNYEDNSWFLRALSPVPGGLEAQRDGPGAGAPPHHRQHGPSGLDLFSTRLL